MIIKIIKGIFFSGVFELEGRVLQANFCPYTHLQGFDQYGFFLEIAMSVLKKLK